MVNLTFQVTVVALTEEIYESLSLYKKKEGHLIIYHPGYIL